MPAGDSANIPSAHDGSAGRVVGSRRGSRRLPSDGVDPVITFHVHGQLRTYCAGASEIPIAAHTVREALEVLERTQSRLYRNVCDETGAVRRHLNVFVNSDNVRDLDGVDTPTKPGDVVTILPAVSGG